MCSRLAACFMTGMPLMYIMVAFYLSELASQTCSFDCELGLSHEISYPTVYNIYAMTDSTGQK